MTATYRVTIKPEKSSAQVLTIAQPSLRITIVQGGGGGTSTVPPTFADLGIFVGTAEPPMKTYAEWVTSRTGYWSWIDISSQIQAVSVASAGGAVLGGSAVIVSNGVMVQSVASTGGAVISGAASVVCNVMVAGLGGAVVGGTALVEASGLNGVTVSSIGGIVSGGESIAVRGAVVVSAGGSTLGGAALATSGVAVLASGGVVLGGEAAAVGESSVVLQTEAVASTGGATVGGAAAASAGRIVMSAGGTVLGGAAIGIKSVAVKSAGGLVAGGGAAVTTSVVFANGGFETGDFTGWTSYLATISASRFTVSSAAADKNGSSYGLKCTIPTGQTQTYYAIFQTMTSGFDGLSDVSFDYKVVSAECSYTDPLQSGAGPMVYVNFTPKDGSGTTLLDLTAYPGATQVLLAFNVTQSGAWNFRSNTVMDQWVSFSHQDVKTWLLSHFKSGKTWANVASVEVAIELDASSAYKAGARFDNFKIGA